MKDLNTPIDFKYYRIILIIINLLMLEGLIFGYFYTTIWEFTIHLLLALMLSISLWVYPKKETNHMKVVIVAQSIIFMYGLVLIYPEINSIFMLVCLIPGIAILFFIPRLFYFSLSINILFITLLFLYIALFDKGDYFSVLYIDLQGNYLNFLASQVIFYFIFYLSYTRLRNQQFYYEHIQQSERLKSTGQIAAAVAHEIRNPITVVKGFLQLYQEENPDNNKEKHEHFALMLDQLQIAETVISDFLEIAKPKVNIETHTVNIKDAIQSVVDLINSYALLNNITLNFNFDDDFYINCNLIEFKQLLINLLKNAIEASPFGGSIIINVKRNSNYVEISLIDSGSGMSEVELKSLGTPFYSLKSKGTGLGLTICFNIVHKYNGSIQFKSEIGKGTVATVKFPIKVK